MRARRQLWRACAAAQSALRHAAADAGCVACRVEQPASRPPRAAPAAGRPHARGLASLPPHSALPMPALSPTMETGSIAKWVKRDGDQVAAGDVLADVQTDKATMAFESQEDGWLAKILVPAGSADIKVGTPVAIMVEDESAVGAFANYAAGAAPTAAASAASPATAARAPQALPAATPGGYTGTRLWPSVRALLSQHGMVAAAVVATGPHGVLTRGDVLAAVAAGGSRAATHAAPAARSAAAAAAAAAPPPPPAAQSAARPGAAAPAAASAAPPTRGAAAHTDTPASNVRKIIASRLLESKRGLPHLYISRDAGLDALLALRKELAARGAKASVNDLVICAAARALAQVPTAAALPPGAAIDIAIAVATPGGLMTPIIRNADRLSLAQVTAEVKALAGRAREGKLKPEEYSGGAFSISNLGMFPVDAFSAIINPPQAAILAVGRAQTRVVLRDGVPASSTMLSAALSCDQARVQGADAARFLAAFAEALEAPQQLVG